MTLAQLRLGPRLAIGFGLTVCMAAAIAALGWLRLAATLDLSRETQRLQAQAASAASWRSLTQLNVTRTLAIAKSGLNPDVEGFLQPQMKGTSAQITTVQKALEADVHEEQAKALMEEVAQLRKTYLALRDTVFTQLKDHDPSVAQRIEQQLLPAAQAYVDAISRFEAHQQQRADQATTDMAAAGRQAQWVLAGLASLCVAIGTLAAWLITRSVTRPMQQAVSVTGRIATGDLSTDVCASGRDEVAELIGGLSTMQSSLRQLVGDVQQATHEIRNASGDVAAGSRDLSQRTEEAAANLEQTAASMEQISSTVKQTAQSAASASDLAGSASSAASRGGEIVAQVVQAMQHISEHAKNIGDITGLIDSIAFQTNILALNAAVEAARAGEHGRGFAVVAEEVRTLAQRSANAAREIRKLIDSSNGTVANGERLVGDAGASMQEIVASVERVCTIVNEISNAATEQTTGIGQINSAVTQLDQMTQQNAALVEQSAAASESMQHQAARLSSLVSAFRLPAGSASAVG